MSRDPIGALGLFLVTTIIFIAFFADFLMPYDPNQINVLNRLADPTWEHWLGTDNLGRDSFSRVLIGTRVAMQVAIVSIGLAMVGGIVLGLISGYGPKWLDSLLVLIFDSMSSLPMIMFAMAVITVLGPGTYTLIIVIVSVSIPGYARMIRAQTLSLKNSEFILAERSLNASSGRIIFNHLLPNVVGSLVILASMDMPVVIMLEAGLSFLGLGIKPPDASWGTILNDGYSFIRDSPVLIIAGGGPLILATLGFTFLGESLRDALDPKLKKRGSK
ncbi:ABC transporter permease [Kiloniella laminariae]|uniref:ABC transporter permease n=1 Tax=Kiloniella laminariae TaxID=454162 RepID=A0ABT4LPK9_9PROT|nr:ABC transporter permease [Kiloniella laminariae]MCZ4283063.1 ABC transporter permease [Kiloniella laminariae]